MTDKYGFNSLEGFLFVCFKASEVHVTALKVCQQLGVPWKYQAVGTVRKPFMPRRLLLFFFFYFSPLEIRISL